MARQIIAGLIAAFVVAGLSVSSTQAAESSCTDSAREHCATRLSNCTRYIDWEQDPNASLKSANCHEDFRSCMAANGC